METNKAIIKREETTTTLVLHVNNEELEIVLTDDNPNNVKSVFNTLLKELKRGLIIFNLEDTKEDLYQNICNEYLKQLNIELRSVYNELNDYELLEEQ